MIPGTRVWLLVEVDDYQTPEDERTAGTIQPAGTTGYVRSGKDGAPDEYSAVAPFDDMVVVQWDSEPGKGYEHGGAWEHIADLVMIGRDATAGDSHA